MSIRLHPDSDRLQRRLERCQALVVRWTGNVYRVTTPQYANREDVISGVGSRIDGARWNPPSGFPAVYCGLELETIIDEIRGQAKHYGCSLAEMFPRVIVSMKVNLERVLDLRDGMVRKSLGVSRSRLLGEPWREMQAQGEEAITQAIGRLAHLLGLHGLLVDAAARRGGSNLVVFRESLGMSGSGLELFNSDRLPSRQL